MTESLDTATLEMLEELLGPDFPDLVETFLRDGPQRLAALREALAGGAELVALERPAHTLKGAAANLGATRLTELCAELVQDCRSGAAPRAEAQVMAIAEELERVMTALRARLGEGGESGAP